MVAAIFFILFLLGIVFFKQIMLVFSILSGNKEILKDVGNFCEDKVPWRDTIWTKQELGQTPLSEDCFHWKDKQ